MNFGYVIVADLIRTSTLNTDSLPQQEIFPLKPVAVFVSKEKMSVVFGLIANRTSGRFYYQMNLAKRIGTASTVLSLRRKATAGTTIPSAPAVTKLIKSVHKS